MRAQICERVQESVNVFYVLHVYQYCECVHKAVNSHTDLRICTTIICAHICKEYTSLSNVHKMYMYKKNQCKWLFY